MTICQKNNKIIFEFPATYKRSNPYMPDEDVGDCPTFMGLIVKHRKNGNNYDEMGFAQRIDMDYKNKLDQVGDFIVKWHKSEEEFIKECEKLGLIIETITL